MPEPYPVSSLNRNELALASLTAYCNLHPEQRFWQSLRNWSGFDQVMGVGGSVRIDTFNLEGLDGIIPIERPKEPTTC